MSPEQTTHTPYSQRSVRSFALRAGRMTRGQKSSYEQLGPKYCLPYCNFAVPPSHYPLESARQEAIAALQRDYWQKVLCQRRKLLCEIGFGNGAATWQLVQRNPQALYLGIEVYRSGVASLLQQLAAHELENCRIVEHDALEVLENMLPAACLDGLLIFFPDPWPKKKHSKRRLVSAANLQLFCRSLKVGGYLYFVTDWPDYAASVRGLLAQQAQWWHEANGAEDAGLKPRRPQSKFEARASGQGRPSLELFLRKRSPR